jgi:PAS domain-containing protein
LIQKKFCLFSEKAEEILNIKKFSRKLKNLLENISPESISIINGPFLIYGCLLILNNERYTLLYLLPFEIFEEKIVVNTIIKDLVSIIENTYDSLYITDGNKNTLRVNQAYERITGIKREEAAGKNMR